jgi:two-component system, LytTR family, sensor histidine kinase AlgZ
MKEPEILSTLQLPASALSPPGAVPEVRVLVFDACHVGVVLRAVWFVFAVVGVGLLFVHPLGWHWLLELAALTAVVQPAVLLWLSLGCALKTHLGRWPLFGQVAAGVALGALAGVFAAGLWAWLDLGDAPRWLAAALAGALLAGVLVAGLVWRTRAQLPAGTAARLTELQSRIRPHFLFNTLNSAIALVRAEPARAEALLEDLSELFRSALADSQQAVTLAQELALAERYLAIEQVRFGPRLRLNWALDADPAVGRAALPPLLLQPLVENAVKHGVEPSVSGAEIHISTQRRGGTVVIKVTNTVPAGRGLGGMGLALANVRERLALMHDLKASFKSGEVNGSYVVRLRVPL